LRIDLRYGQALVRERSVSGEHSMVGRHAGRELRQDVPLPALGDDDAGRAEVGDVGGDLQGTDRSARDKYTLPAVRHGVPILVCGDHTRRTCERVEPENAWNGGGLEPAGRHHHSFEALGAAGGVHEPSRVISVEALDPRAEPDARHQPELLGGAAQVVEDVAARRIHEVGLVLQVAEGRQDPTGVGVHRRPYPTEAGESCPLAANRRRLFKDNSHRAAASPPGPAPITATFAVIRELSHVCPETRHQTMTPCKSGLI
jgi:hypothetical protein